LLSWLAIGYLLAVVFAAIALRAWTDVWWPVTVFAYAPRWVLAVPFPFVVAMLAVSRRWRLLAAMLPAAIALLVVIDFRLNMPAGAATGPTLKVMTFNVAGKHTPVDKLRDLLRAAAPQVVALQECELELKEFESEGWHVHADWELCLLSRFPIREAEVRDTTVIRARGGHGVAIRYVIDAPSGPVAIVNLHLQTVRKGIEALMEHHLAGRAGMTANTEIRELDSRTLRRWIDEFDDGLPIVVMGDFNLPVESAVYRGHWSSFGNAFSTAGFGLGWTKRTRWHGTRIDHVLFGSGLRCAEASTAGPVGSDHRAVMARLSIERAR
jgi:endonuclease/exonuclease/phosphatase family metal-dependent hydrolase